MNTINDLNEYMYNILNLVFTYQTKGLLQKPLKYRINRNDKRILNKIYDVYKVYEHKITRKEFIKLTINYSVSSGINIIRSGQDVASSFEKIKH